MYVSAIGTVCGLDVIMVGMVSGGDVCGRDVVVMGGRDMWLWLVW